MATYLVSLTIRAGEYEKSSDTFVIAENEDLAADYAVLMESHDASTLQWDDSGAADLGWQFYYQYNGIKKVNRVDIAHLEKYFKFHTACELELHAAGDWLTHQTN